MLDAQSASQPALPPESPLAMPTQALSRFDEQTRRTPINTHPDPLFYRILTFGGGLLLTGYGTFEMYRVVSVTSVTFLQWLLVALFSINFSWIALAFCSAILGFFALIKKQPATGPIPPLTQRTALVMPVYNETPSRVFAALQAMIEEIDWLGQTHAFDVFVLSDTTDSNIWVAEERTFLALRDRLQSPMHVYYRHRPRNIGRKSGNIEDFVTRWGGSYPFMLVLDADSVMSGDCIVGLAHAMEQDPDAGIIQSLPLITNRNTFFARLQQFAARIYGPVIATGLALWSGREGNYWGHNAIIRTKAFADHAGLPVLSGKPPFGGHILSHDFVEAALIRRAGWSVYMLPHLAGSYEESPPSLIDLSVRDRRWCQGNLQHSRVIGAKGLTWPTRQHFATGIMSYLASPFWLAQLFVGILLVLQSTYVRPEYFTQQFSLFPTWPRFDAERALALFELTMGILLAPKFFGLILAIGHKSERQACGGAIMLILSALLEILISALVAPIMMLIQSGAVTQILLGRDTGWNPQRRDDGSIPMADIIRRHRLHVALGVIVAITAFIISPSLFGWMSPTIIGLVLSIPLSAASSSLALGLTLKKLNLLLIPEERSIPPVIARANALQADYKALNFDEADGMEALATDQALCEAHLAMLPTIPRRHRGDIDAERAVAEAKLADAQTLADAINWLKPKERNLILSDRALLHLVTNLPLIHTEST